MELYLSKKAHVSANLPISIFPSFKFNVHSYVHLAIGTTVIAGRIAAVEDREGYWAIVFDDGSELTGLKRIPKSSTAKLH